MTRWYDRLLPRSLRPTNGKETDRQKVLRARVESAHDRVDRLERKLAEHPEDEYALRLRDALLRGM